MTEYKSNNQEIFLKAINEAFNYFLEQLRIHQVIDEENRYKGKELSLLEFAVLKFPESKVLKLSRKL